ncbi:MAG TPA: alpha/beta hydrolase-fold protein [Rhizomicrobium sp.]|jgi:enterochelin esterase family protein|nr:alpha/beta hydrolase-fold protein [Rhizomicrobium sp.]
MKKRIVSTLIAATALLAPLPLQAQVPPGVRLDATGHPGPNVAPEEYSRPRRTISPVIHPDRSVTLKVNAPLAREVRVTGHIIGMNAHWNSAPRKSIPMTKGADGIWSVTLGPLKPDIYDYGYLVDGYPAGDIGNRLNYVEVPGDGPAYYDARDVPHGDVHLVVYNSKATDSVRYLRVYTPPGYEAGTARYPVLYLQHGGNCCESSWMEQARANLIMDNLIAAKKARPMIIVMALGARSGPSEGIGPVPSQMEGARGLGKGQTNYDPGNRFEVDLLTGIIPFIDHKYRTIADADHRALSGLSQGGIQTVTIGLRHTGVFHWLVPMSAGAESAGDDQFMDISKDVFADVSPLKKNLKLLHFVVGDQDVLHEADKRLADRLAALGVKLTFTTEPGMHEYKVWRKGLWDVAPELFRGVN